MSSVLLFVVSIPIIVISLVSSSEIVGVGTPGYCDVAQGPPGVPMVFTKCHFGTRDFEMKHLCKQSHNCVPGHDYCSALDNRQLNRQLSSLIVTYAGDMYSDATFTWLAPGNNQNEGAPFGIYKVTLPAQGGGT